MDPLRTSERGRFEAFSRERAACHRMVESPPSSEAKVKADPGECFAKGDHDPFDEPANPCTSVYSGAKTCAKSQNRAGSMSVKVLI